jgi:hypothetical protein
VGVPPISWDWGARWGLGRLGGAGGWAASWPDGFLEGLAVRKLDHCRQQIKYLGS